MVTCCVLPSSMFRASFDARSQFRVFKACRRYFPSTVPSAQHGQLQRRYRREVCGHLDE